LPIKPRYVKIKWDAVTFIKDRKQLAVWLKNGSLQKGDIVYELKLKYRVTIWKPDGSLVLEDISNEEEVS
jgi:hypothetical protein